MTWYDQLPKVELHLHLEGAIPHEALWELIKKYGGDALVPDYKSLTEKFQFRDFPHFLEIWGWKNKFLKEYEDFTFIARQAAQDLLSQNIFYAEIFFSPKDFARFGLKTQKLIEAVRGGFSQVKGIELKIIVDFVRDFGPRSALDTLSDIRELKELGVIGVGLGGAEQNYPPEIFTEVFEQARKAGFFTSVHAGEVAGPESIWGAINHLKADRIGHGTRAPEDNKLINYLVEKSIPLEICPLSNLRTGVIKNLKDHPLRYFFDKGILVTVNTDDPKMFGNSLAEEYESMFKIQGFSRNEIFKIILNGIDCSWLSHKEKIALRKRFNKIYNHIEKNL
ncbi:MAG: adenosine deaminase [Candidatus Neomarinimicrobiota bacterium]